MTESEMNDWREETDEEKVSVYVQGGEKVKRSESWPHCLFPELEWEVMNEEVMSPSTQHTMGRWTEK